MYGYHSCELYAGGWKEDVGCVGRVQYSSRPRRRASPRMAEGLSPTARGAYRIYCSLSISPQSRHAGGDARAPRTHVVQSCCPSLSAVRTPEPRRGFPALREGLSPHALTFHLRLRRAEALSEIGQALRAGSTQVPLAMARIPETPAPQGLPCAQGGLEPARTASRPTTDDVGLLLL